MNPLICCHNIIWKPQYWCMEWIGTGLYVNASYGIDADDSDWYFWIFWS